MFKGRTSLVRLPLSGTIHPATLRALLRTLGVSVRELMDLLADHVGRAAR